jgi:crossover junction endodeoxyribonuclease RusA
MSGPLEVSIDVFPPDRRRRDVDNVQKALLDALAHGGAYHDDSQINRLSIERQSVVRGGKVHVLIEEYPSE